MGEMQQLDALDKSRIHEHRKFGRCPSLLSSRISIDARTGCWNWLGSLDGKGYGVVGRNSRRYPAHRYVYELFNGPISETLEAHHQCENKRCVNPHHIHPVSKSTNLMRAFFSRRRRNDSTNEKGVA